MPKLPCSDVNLYYQAEGEGQALVFIHGLGSSTRDWEFQVPEFSRDYKVITFDLRGHGQSDKPPGPYSISTFATDTAGLLKGLKVESAHVVGISLGGAVAFQFAIDYPALVRTMVIVNSAPIGVGTTPEGQREIAARVQLVNQQGMGAMGLVLGQRLFPEPELGSVRQTFVERWAENDPRSYIDALLSLADWNVMDRLGSIHCPTLVLAADQDYTPVAVKEAYVKLIPNARLVVIPNAHHATPLERPQAFNAALKEFLAK